MQISNSPGPIDLESSQASNPFFLMSVGTLLIGSAFGIIFWLISTIRALLYTPEQFLLIDKFLKASGTNETLLKGLLEGKEFSLIMNDALKYGFYLLICLFLLISLGSIVSSLLTQGVNLIIKTYR